MFQLVTAVLIALAPEGVAGVTVTQGSVIVGPDSSIERSFRFAPGDLVEVSVEATRQVPIADGSSDVLSAIAKVAMAFAKPKVSTVEIREYEGGPLVQAGDSQVVNLGYVVPAGGPFSIVIKNSELSCRKTYEFKVLRYPAHESLVRFDTRLAPVRTDTLVEELFDQLIYLPALQSESRGFDVPVGAGKLVLIVSNEASYNLLTSQLGSSLASIAMSSVSGKPVPIDLSAVRTGKDFGYSICWFNPATQGWLEFSPSTRIVCEHRSIDLAKYPYTRWGVVFDNTFSLATSKTVKLKVYAVTLKPVYK